MQRITMTLPDELVEDLDVVSAVVGCSRSALVSLVLSEQLDVIMELATSIRETTSEEVTMLRAKGESLGRIEQRYREILDGFEMHR